MIISTLAVLMWMGIVVLTIASLRALGAETVRAARTGEGNASLSVIVAAHDEETRVGELVESVLAQDHADFELIVVDDRSTDRTLEAARAAAHGDHRARFIRVDERPEGWQGRLYAQSVGVREAQGEWLLFLSADQRLVGGQFLRSILAEYQRRRVRAASVIGPFPGQRWWQTWWYRPIVDNPVLLGLILLLQRRRPEATWLIGALAMRRQTYDAVGGAPAAASFGAGVFDDWGWTRVFEQHRMRTAMVYHGGLHDVSNWETMRDAWYGLSRWAAGILTCRRHAWVIGMALAAFLFLSALATGHTVFELAHLSLPGVVWAALAAGPPTVGAAYCRERGYWMGWSLLSAPLAVLMLAPLIGGGIAKFRNRILWRTEEIVVSVFIPSHSSSAMPDEHRTSTVRVLQR